MSKHQIPTHILVLSLLLLLIQLFNLIRQYYFAEASVSAEEEILDVVVIKAMHASTYYMQDWSAIITDARSAVDAVGAEAVGAVGADT